LGQWVGEFDGHGALCRYDGTGSPAEEEVHEALRQHRREWRRFAGIEHDDRAGEEAAVELVEVFQMQPVVRQLEPGARRVECIMSTLVEQPQCVTLYVLLRQHLVPAPERLDSAGS